jgi:hypothetical protein
MSKLRAMGWRILLVLALGLGSLGAGPVAGPTPPQTELDPPRCFPHAQLWELAQRAHENPNLWPSEEPSKKIEILERLSSPSCEADAWWIMYYFLILDRYDRNKAIEIIQGAKNRAGATFSPVGETRKGRGCTVSGILHTTRRGRCSYWRGELLHVR